MKDKDLPGYNHGGGKIKNYGGETVIQPSAFKYKSPCLCLINDAQKLGLLEIV